MIDPKRKLTVTKQAKLLKISRDCVYYSPRLPSDRDLITMHFMDQLHTQQPFIGSQMIKTQLNGMGMKIGCTHIRTLMKRMGKQALAPQPGTSKVAPGNKISRFTQKCSYRASKSSVCVRHKLHSNGQGFRVFNGSA